MRFWLEKYTSPLAVAVLLLTANASASEKPGDAPSCPRKFTDEQIDQILIEKLPIKYAHRLSVNYTRCRYFVAIWPLPITVDSNLLVDLDQDGNLPDVVVKYGLHGNDNEAVSYRKISELAYPAGALSKGVSGKVLVRVSVASDGTVSGASIAQVLPRGAVELTDGLVDAIRGWRFFPLTRYGNALTSDVLVPVRFVLTNQPSPSWDQQSFDKPDDLPLLDAIDVKRDFTTGK